MIAERLNEEKWTRATLNSYTINHFKELDEIINIEFNNEQADSLKDLCNEHLSHTKNSIIALYIFGVLSYMHQDIYNNPSLIELIEIFKENHKTNIVEFLCERILEFGENNYALRTLAENYTNNREEEKKIAIWERIVKIDFEETEILKQLAELKKESGKIDEAVKYYKKAIYRYINKKRFSNVKDIWNRIIELAPNEKEFFFHVIKNNIYLSFDYEKANSLLDELFNAYKEQKDWTTCIDILKQILIYEPTDTVSRRSIVECYRNLYADNERLEEYINLSNLNQNWRNVHEAIADFEKHISFDVGHFVYHRTWGIGIIRQLSNDELSIDFARKRAHTMSLKMASGALYSLPKAHIWVLKSVWPKEKLRDKIKSDVLWGLKVIIKSFENTTSLKQIKTELVPTILSPGEWVTWSTEAKKILKSNPNFGNLPDQVDIYEVRTTPITIEEKLYNQFKAEKDFYGKLKAIQEYILNGDSELDYFLAMHNYLITFTKNLTVINDQVISAWLFTKWAAKTLPFMAQSINKTFFDLISEIENIVSVFNDINDSSLKKDFLDNLKEIKDWNKIYITLFPVYLNKYIIEELIRFHHNDDVKFLFKNIFDRFKDNRNSFLWIIKNIENLDEFEIKKEQIIISLIHLLDITCREIDNKQDVSTNRKYNKQAETLLIKENRIEEFLNNAHFDSVSRTIDLILDVRGFDNDQIEKYKKIVTDRFPDFTFLNTENDTSGRESISRGLIVSLASYQTKQRELKYIIDVEIPKNSKEIGAAIELGDLKENAEYKAGKEKQEILNITASKLKEDLDRAHIFTFEKIDITRVSYANVICLKNNTTAGEEIYTILGPWESDPDNKIISYLSPFGKALFGSKVNDKLLFTINERNYDYEVISIEVAEEPIYIEAEERIIIDFE